LQQTISGGIRNRGCPTLPTADGFGGFGSSGFSEGSLKRSLRIAGPFTLWDAAPIRFCFRNHFDFATASNFQNGFGFSCRWLGFHPDLCHPHKR